MFGTWEVREDWKKEQKEDKKEGIIPIGFIASAAAPFVGEIAKPLLKKNFGERRSTTPTYNATKNSLIKRTLFLAMYETVSRQNFPWIVKIKQTRRIGPRNKCTKKAQKGGSLNGNIAKWGRSGGGWGWI